MATEVSAPISVKIGSSSLLPVPLKRPKEGIMAHNVKKRKADEQLGPRPGKRPQLVLTPKGRVEPILSDTSTLPYDYSDITYGPEDNTALGAFEEGPNLSDEDDVDSLAGEEGDLPHRPTDPMRDDMPIVTSRWQKEEVDALMTAMNINRDAIKFHFDGPGGGVDVKRQAWRDVATYVNDIAQTHRTVQQCRNKVDDYTQRVKGKYNKLRQAVGQTGRGTIKQGLRLKEIEHKALDYLREEAVRAQCRVSLGMQSGEIPDYAITSSSSYDPDSVGPENARIRTESKGGAWCPGQQVSEDVYEYLEVDLQQLKIISLVETQGRFGNGQGQEYADQYLLEYQREEGGTWFRFHNRRGQEIFQGNTNTYIAELREVDPPIIARKVRFIPYSGHPRTVCLRVELYGCPWKDGSISYSMHRGERRGTEVDLYDFTYDGKISDTELTGGLGQLTDGEIGESNFRLDPKGFGNKGYEWVGWRNETHKGKPIEIIFKFDDVRNFSAIRIHANNMFNKDVRVFKRAKLFFSIGGDFYASEPVEFRYMRDTLIEFARQVIITLPNQIGKFVKLQLFFDSKWMMISEIQFESDYAVGNFTPEIPPSTVQPIGASTKDANIVQVIDLLPNGKHNKTAGSHKVPPTYEDADNPGKATSTLSTLAAEREKKTLDEEYIGIIIGALAALILLLFLVIIIIIIRQRHRKSNNNHQTLLKTSIVPRHVTLDLNDLQANSVNEATLNRDYAVPDITKSSFGTLRPNIPPPAYTPNMYGHTTLRLPPAASHYAAADVVNIPNIQGVSGSNVYAVPTADLVWTEEDLSVMEFPRDNLQFIEKLGEGQFGEVHLCEAQQMAEFIGDDFLLNRTASSNSMLVAVKTLRRNADQPARTDFQKEVKIMSRVKDPNIVRVLAVCLRDDPMSVIVEYMKFGDLHQFLEQHVAENTTPKKKHAKVLSRGCLIYMSTQIASGMKYLESLNMVHRDLATRNCLVGHNYTIKISDFGMSRNLYSSDYYRIEGRAVLPIRWMAWESILLGKFSCKSDVWSFGVTLWEVLTLAREQPFDNLTDEQVIENAGHYYRADELEAYLPQPVNCPREIFDLIKECWNREEVQRPTFREIHMFLQRKNMGYDPVHDAGLYNNKMMNVPIV